MQQTVILDCCHSGSATRIDDSHPTRLARFTKVVKNLPADLDQDIWQVSGNVRGTYIVPGFLQSGLRSHVLLAACGAQELAMEDHGPGIFTQALLEVLTTVSTDKIRYSDLLHRINQLPA